MSQHLAEQADTSNQRVVQLDYKVAELETRVGQLLGLLTATGMSVAPETTEPGVASAASAARSGF